MVNFAAIMDKMNVIFPIRGYILFDIYIDTSAFLLENNIMSFNSSKNP